MSNLHAELVIINCENGKPNRKDLEQLFFDLDFTENEEYFREDTLELGFKSESDRIIDELLSDELTATEVIEACIEKQLDSSGFYTDHSLLTIIEDDRIIVSISFTTEF